MQKIILKLLILFLALFAGIMLKAQSFKAIYEFDANGNRTKATIFYLSLKSTILDQNEDYLESNVVDSLADCIIRVFPNPTQGELIIEIKGVSPEQFSADGNSISIWDMQGKLVQNIQIFDTHNLFDVSQITVGSYILKVCINGIEKDFKIVKE